MFKNLKVKDLSKLSGVSIRTLHYYDEIGLLVPTRAENGHRLYSYEDVVLLNEINMYTNLGFSLEQIKQMTAPSDNFDIKTSLHNQKQLLNIQIEQLQSKLNMIETLLNGNAKDNIENEVLMNVLVSNNPLKNEVKKIWNIKKLNSEIYQEFNPYNHQIDFDYYFEMIARLQNNRYDSPDVKAIIQKYCEALHQSFGGRLTDEHLKVIANAYVENANAREYLTKYGKKFPQFLCESMLLHLNSK